MAEEKYICCKALLRCSGGTTPAELMVYRSIDIGGKPMANIQDYSFPQNVRPFGNCIPQAKPVPPPCIPSCIPWTGGKQDVLVQGQPAVLESSKLHCMHGGVIEVIQSGQSGCGLVVTDADGVEHESFSCGIPHIEIEYVDIDNVTQKTVLYDQEERDRQEKEKIEELKKVKASE